MAAVAGAVVALPEEQEGEGTGSLGPEWGPAHVRLARLHAAVLCAGRVGSLQDEVSELLFLLASPPDALLPDLPSSQPHTPCKGGGGGVGNAGGLGAPGGGGGAAVGVLGTPVRRALGGGAGLGSAAAPLPPGCWLLPTAVQYACAVLAGCTGLLSGLGHRLVAAVASCAASRLAAPALAEAAEVAAARRERSHTRSRAVDALGGQRLPLLGPLLQASGDLAAGRSRSQEQQRRVSNRERCRDAFFAWASPVLSSFAAAAGPAAAGTGPAPAPADPLVPLRSQCLELLHSLHPDSMPFLAELITGCVLQAAATGESLVEGDLASAARSNPSKFQRLNQRMMQGPGQTGTAAGAPGSSLGGTRATVRPMASDSNGSRAPYATGANGFSHAAGGTCSSASNPAGAPRASTCGAGGGGGGGGTANDASGAGGGGAAHQRDHAYGSGARCAAIAARLHAFPPAQRPFLLFLEAADSHTLLCAVARCMAGVLQSMLSKMLAGKAAAAQAAPTGAAAGTHAQQAAQALRLDEPLPAALGPLGDSAVAAGALSSYLSYFAVVHGVVRYGVALPADADCTLGGVAGGRGTVVTRGSQPLDVLRLLDVAEQHGVLLVAAPWVVSYLYHMALGSRLVDSAASPDGAEDGSLAGSSPADAADVDLPYICSVAARLRRLLRARVLQPSCQQYFCTAALCLRSALEEALGHAAALAGPDVLCGGAQDAGEVGVSDGGEGVQQHGAPRAQEGAVASEAEPGCAAQSKSCVALRRWEEHLAASLQDSDGLVDARFLELCCPALEEASRALQRACAMASGLQHGGSGGGAAGPQGSPGRGTAPLAPRRVLPSSLARSKPGGTAGAAEGGAAGTAAAASLIPESVAEVLAGRGPSALQQSLAQALLAQYSTPGLGLGLIAASEQGGGGAAVGASLVPMRDVVGYVTGVLAVNGAAAALDVVVPQVVALQLQRTADAMRPILRERLAAWHRSQDEAAPGLRAPLHMAEALGAVAQLAEDAGPAAVRASLEAALPAVRRQLRENALRSLQALLPGTVPEEAVAAAAGLAAQSAEVSCLKRLVAQVPSVVRGQVEEQMKPLVKEVLRELERVAAAAAAAEPQAKEAAAAGPEGEGGAAAGGRGGMGAGSMVGLGGAEGPGTACEPHASATEQLLHSTAGPAGCSRGGEAGEAVAQEQRAAAAAAAEAAASALAASLLQLVREPDEAAATTDHAVAATLDAACSLVRAAGQLPSGALSAAAARGAVRPAGPLADPAGELHPVVAAAAQGAAAAVYGEVRGSVGGTARLERLLAGVLKEATGLVSAGGSIAPGPAAAAELDGGSGIGGEAPQGVLAARRAEAAGEEAAGGGAAAPAASPAARRTALWLLGEVALGVLQQHAADAPNWAEAVWSPAGQDDDDAYDRDYDERHEGCEAADAAVQGSPGSQDAHGAGLGASGAGGAGPQPRPLPQPPMLANLYSAFASYARELESYRLLHALRLALQRVTMGHLVAPRTLDGG